jgi:hypothetical protein
MVIFQNFFQPSVLLFIAVGRVAPVGARHLLRLCVVPLRARFFSPHRQETPNRIEYSDKQARRALTRLMKISRRKTMESTFENDHSDPTPQSLKNARHHFQEMFSAASRSDAWNSFKKMIDALPAWALVVAVVSVITLVANAWVVPVVAVVGCGMAGVFYTVKYAVRQALREHDSQSH